MNDVLRSLIYDGQVSLTLADTTAIVNEGIRLHKLSPASAYVYGKAMSALCFISACLKEERGEISLTVRCGGEGEDIGASGNRKLFLRGYIGNTALEGGVEGAEKRAFGENGYLTVVRDDGYNRPFVGTCGFPDELSLDRILEEYFRISEQLPTRIATEVALDEKGGCVFAGVIALQPLPFATDEVLQKVEKFPLQTALAAVREKGVKEGAETLFALDEKTTEIRAASYKCNCSREYLSEVLVTLGEAQIREIIRTEGAVRVHCHYCNTDYEFTAKDADALFPKQEK